MKKWGMLLAVLGGFLTCSAAEIALPAPAKEGGMPLLNAMTVRRTVRTFADKELSQQQISDLLYAAFGVSNSEGKRTAPSALNKQEITLYVLLKSGTYRYDAPKNLLIQTGTKDLRTFANGAPLVLVYVADLTKQPEARWCMVDCGFIGQNVYLYCTSAGLGTVFRGSFPADLGKKMNLDKNHPVLFVQSVGFPAK